ncbi:MAG TPA: protein-disulfide reductase DsbD domain-containing protein [Tepidisphaeraceae bacterium]|nr:protein-disulfide reductase DsbD domain-containing protein [Tepidisphaeraceae bacterium]
MRSSACRALGTLLLLLLLPAVSRAAPQSRGEVKQAVVNYSALRAGGNAMAAVVVEIQKGFHAQSHTPLDPDYIKFEIMPEANAAVTFGEPKYPAGVVENYPELGKLSVYTGRVVLYVPIQVKADAKPGPIEIRGKVRYQVCDDKACYPPEKPAFKITTEIVPAAAEVKPNEPELFKGVESAEAAPAVTAPPPVVKDAGPQGALFQFLTAFLAGILFNVVPCVLPVLPLKAIGFYEASRHSRAKSFSFGVAFSLGLIATFAVFGILIFGYRWIGFTDRPFDWGQLFTKWWFTLAIVGILLAMALGTFGAFNVGVPRGLYSISPRHDTYLGNFEFGILTALLSTPCTFGMFVIVLGWAALQLPIIGVLILVTVGAGMASPYLVLSALPEVARRFPRTGPWAELVKQMMGFLLLLAAVYFARPFLGRVVHGEMFWWLPFGVVVAAAIYLVLKSMQFARTNTGRVVGSLLAVLLVVGALRVVLQLTQRPFVWQPYSNQALEQARASGRIALVEFTADWCGNCQFVEAHVLHSRPVVESVRKHDVVMLKADVTRDDAPARPLLETLNPAGSIPLTVIYAPGSRNPIELTGIYSKEDLQSAIQRASESEPTSVAQR